MKNVNIKKLQKKQDEINKERTPIFNNIKDSYSKFLSNSFSIKKFYQ